MLLFSLVRTYLAWCSDRMYIFHQSCISDCHNMFQCQFLEWNKDELLLKYFPQILLNHRCPAIFHIPCICVLHTRQILQLIQNWFLKLRSNLPLPLLEPPLPEPLPPTLGRTHDFALQRFGQQISLLAAHSWSCKHFGEHFVFCDVNGHAPFTVKKNNEI